MDKKPNLVPLKPPPQKMRQGYLSDEELAKETRAALVFMLIIIGSVLFAAACVWFKA
jgi:hypothetical protein